LKEVIKTRSLLSLVTKRLTHLITGEYVNLVKPLPKGEISIRERIFAEHRPRDDRVVVLIRIPKINKSLSFIDLT
jgi:hypothetical protein